MYNKNEKKEDIVHTYSAVEELNLKLTSEQKDILVGTLLGDASMTAQKCGKYNIKFEQSVVHEDYILHLYEVFKDWCGVGPKKRFIGLSVNGNPRFSIWFRTYRHSSFRFFYHQFYDKKSGKKRVPRLIHRWMNPRVLAYWYMDDGSISASSNDIMLNTQCFSFSEQRKLAKALGRVFSFKVTVQKDKNFYRLYISAENYNQFKGLVLPYMLDSFLYKLR